MSVLIGLACREQARTTVFYKHLLRMMKGAPTGSDVEWQPDPSLAHARNLLCERALARGDSHLLLLDDDHLFPPTLLTRLLSHDLDIVTGLYLMRHWPFHACIFSHFTESGQCMPLPLKPGMSGLVKIAAAGAGCLLIKTDVLRVLPKPWFIVGTPIPDLINEDFNFAKACLEAGIEMYCDLDMILGHSSLQSVWPWRNAQDQWMTCLVSPGGEEKLYVAPALGLLQAKQKRKEAAEAAKEAESGS